MTEIGDLCSDLSETRCYHGIHCLFPRWLLNTDYACRDSCYDGVIGDRFKDHIGADDRPSADPNIPQDSGPGSDENTVFNDRHPQDSRAPADRHARTDLSPDSRALMDHDSDPSISE